MEDSQQFKLDQALGFLRRRGVWIVACMILAGVAAFAISKAQEKKYTASAAVIFNEDQLTQEIAGLPATATNALLQHASNLELLDLGNMASRTAAKVGHGLTERDVEEAVSINGDTESNIASVSATDVSPVLATRIANTYARQFVKEQGSANAEYFQSALKLVRKQIAALSTGEKNGTAGIDLLARAHSLALLAELQPSSVEVVQRATVPGGPSSPTTKKNTVIGLILGFFLGLGIALLLERIDPRIRGSRELAAIYDAQLLGTVPRSARVAGYSAAAALDGLQVEAEAFQVIRAQLASFNSGQNPSSILISSAVQGEGKSTIAFHLAGAAARTGSRVLLIEANFRRPSLAGRLGLAASPSLLEAVDDRRGVEQVAQIAAGFYAGQGSLYVLPAGSLGGQSPATVIDSQAMDRILGEAAGAYDLVVVDGPDLAGISDAFLLMGKVDGLVIVGLNGRSRRDTAEDLVQRLHASKARVYGVVANGVGRNRGRARTEGFEAAAPQAAAHIPSADAEIAPGGRVQA